MIGFNMVFLFILARACAAMATLLCVCSSEAAGWARTTFGRGTYLSDKLLSTSVNNAGLSVERVLFGEAGLQGLAACLSGASKDGGSRSRDNDGDVRDGGTTKRGRNGGRGNKWLLF
jgi:hypothetical protein